MNLKQIIRNQKTQKFDLTSLVRDTEETLHESSTGFSSGVAATSSTWATIKSLYESEEYDKLLRSKIINKDGQKVQVGTAIDYSYKQGQMNKSEKEAYRQAIAAIGDAVAKGKIEKEDIPANEKEVLDRARKQSTATAAEPSQDTDTDDDKDSYDDELANLLSKDDDDKEGDAEEAEEKLSDFPPPKYPTQRPDESTITKAEDSLEELREDGFLKGEGKLSDENSESSDGRIKQVALLMGYPAGGAAKPYILGNEDELTKKQKEAGVQALGLEPGNSELQEWRAAPGNAGSLMNEILSCEGANILNENPDLSPEELAILMYKQFGETEAAQQNLGPKPAGGFKKGVVPEGYNPGLYTKILASAYAAKAKDDLARLGIDVNSDENGFDRDSAELSQFYGAKESIEAQVKMAEDAERIFSPGGDEITDRDELIRLIKAGGGGDNPSDTATFIKDKNGNLIVAFHSDKMSTSDIQANSTIFQEIEEMKKVIEDDDSIDSNDKQKIYERLEVMREEVEQAEASLPKVLVEPAQVLADHIEGDEKLQTQMLDRMRQEKDIKKKVDPMLKKFRKAATGKYTPPPGTTEKIKKYLTTEDPSDEEIIVAFMKYSADPEPPKLTEEQQKIISRTAKLYQDEINDDALKIESRLDSIRKDTIRAEQNARKDLNEMGSVKVRGKDVSYGDYLEAKNIEKKLHLGAINQGRDEPPEAEGIMKYADAFKLNMAGVVVGPEQLKECMNVEDTDDLIINFEVDDVDPDDDSSKNLIFDRSVDPPQVTGRKASVYAVTKDGNKIPIAEKSLRSKSGQLGRLQSTYTWSKEMQDCFKGKDKKTNESLSRLLGDILTEEKINTLAHHWKIAEDDYPVDLFIKELNERSLN